MIVSTGRATLPATLRTTLAIFMLMPIMASISCARNRGARRPAQSPQPQAMMLGTLAGLDPVETFRRAGLLTASGPVSFVGNVRFLAGPTPDSVLAVVAISLPSRSLTFAREGDRYRATYAVEFELLEKTTGIAKTTGQFKAQETVRVSTLRETTRAEESIIFQQLTVIPPGSYTASLTVRDLGANRSGTAEASVVAPQFGGPEGTPLVRKLAQPTAVYAATPRTSRSTYPNLVVSARSTSIFGRDSVMRVYLEWYGSGAVSLSDRAPALQISVVRADDGHALYADSVVAAAWSADGQIATAITSIPIPTLGLGRLRINAWYIGSRDTVSAPIFVSAADDLAAVSLEELLGYLRYFATTEHLRVLRDTVPDAKAGTWTAFLRSTDPSPATSEHEGLREYFSRLAVANARFRGEDVPGWLSDRGMVYSTLGEPDRIVEPLTGGDRTRQRAQVWEYGQHRLRLVFIEQEGTSRWRLTPSSEAEFQATAQRVRR
jgi:GWxTD domain-containing protein